MNVLAGPDPDLVVDNLVGIFRSIFAAYWGPANRRRPAIGVSHPVAQCVPSRTGRAWPTCLGCSATRSSGDPLWPEVQDDSVGLGAFWKWYESMGDTTRAQVIGPVMNKLRAFLLRDFVRQVVGRA